MNELSEEGFIIRHQYKGKLYYPDMQHLNERTQRIAPNPHPDTPLILIIGKE